MKLKGCVHGLTNNGIDHHTHGPSYRIEAGEIGSRRKCVTTTQFSQMDRLPAPIEDLPRKASEAWKLTPQTPLSNDQR